MSGFAANRMLVRRVVHDTLAGRATYTDDLRDEPVHLKVRHRFRSDLTGTMQSLGLAETYDTPTRIVFDACELDDKEVTVRPGGRLTILDFHGPDKPKTFTLANQIPDDGPLAVVWTVGD